MPPTTRDASAVIQIPAAGFSQLLNLRGVDCAVCDGSVRGAGDSGRGDWAEGGGSECERRARPRRPHAHTRRMIYELIRRRRTAAVSTQRVALAHPSFRPYINACSRVINIIIPYQNIIIVNYTYYYSRFRRTFLWCPPWPVRLMTEDRQSITNLDNTIVKLIGR